MYFGMSSFIYIFQVRFYMNHKPAKPWRISPAKFCKNVRHQLPHLRKLHTGRPLHQILKHCTLLVCGISGNTFTFFLCGGSLNPYITANGSLWSWMWVQCCYWPKTLVKNSWSLVKSQCSEDIICEWCSGFINSCTKMQHRVIKILPALRLD